MSVRDAENSAEKFMQGGGEMGALVRAFDWSKTPLGPPLTWPQSLRTSVGLMLNAHSALSVIWGPDYIQFYNDQYRPILGSTKHPSALGSSVKVSFAESWHMIEPFYEKVMQGAAVGYEDWMIPLDRNGYLEECYFTYSYNPIRIENGDIGGIFVIVLETTDRVLNDRRLVTLRDLALHTETEQTEAAIFKVALDTLKANPADIPFALLYEAKDAQFNLTGSTGIAQSPNIAPQVIQASDEGMWPLKKVRDSHEPLIIDDVQARFGNITGRLWPEKITKAIMLPIMQLGQDIVHSVLVVGINPRHAYDEQYANFLTLVNSQITTAVNKVFAARELEASIKAQLEVVELRREMTQAERDAQAAIDNIIENISYPFYMLDRDLRFLYVNLRAQEIWSKTRQDLIGKNIWDAFPIPTPTLDQVRVGLDRAVAEQMPQVVETFSSTYTKGVPRWWETNIYPSPTGIAVYFRDITDRKTTELLRERLELVLDNIEGGFLIFDKERRHVYLNQDGAELALKATGFTRDQIIGMRFEDSFPDIVNRRLYRELKRSMSEQISITFENYVELLKSWVEYHIYPSLDYVAVFILDITARKQEEQERAQLDALLDVQNQRLANIMSTVPGVIWENYHTDEQEEMKLVFISDYVETMLGYTAKEALDDPHFWLKIFHPDDAKAASKAFYDVLQSGGSGVVNFRAIHKNGRVIDVQAIMVVVMKDGKPVGKRGVMMDVTERQQLINAQARYATMLHRSNNELQQFAYVASHDLQEPLRMVTSYMQIIESRYANQLDNDAREFIAYAVDGASRMKALINDLLAYSRIEGGEKIFEEFDLQIALDKSLSNLALKITDSAAVITSDAMPHVKADMMQMTQLFQNLIGNALKFHSGVVPKIHIGVERKASEWQFSVSDNGIGIAPEHIERIFVIFQRLHKKGEYPGTGIGLSICKKVVERHGGRIWVESKVGEGTTFFFTLPA